MGKFKYGATQWGMPGNGWYGVRLAKEAGLDGLQLELGSYERGYPLAQKQIQQAYLEEGGKYGIQFPSLGLNDINVNYFIKGRNSDIGKISYEQMELAVETAHAMGIGMIMVPLFLDNEPKTEEDYENAAEGLRFCCRKAQSYGIDITSESCIDAASHLKLLQMVDMPNHTVFYDVQNYRYWGKIDQMETLRALWGHIYPQIHVKDGTGMYDNGGHLSGSPLFAGDAHVKDQLDFLLGKGYEGWMILENYYDQLPLRACCELDQLSLVKEDLKNLKAAVD